MTLGSLFDGSGGFPLAGLLNGIEPVWASEIEPYPIRVTMARLPGMEHLGDVKKIDGAKIASVDIITFGSPCQDLSIAGKQAGIQDGERSSLFFDAIRIIKEMRANDGAAGGADEHRRPRFAVWENVPGAFSSNGGEDFRAVLEAFCSVKDREAFIPRPEGGWKPAGCIMGDGYSVAWRVYDAQYWGVPQRRKRIYLVADFAGERAGEILFERESLSGNTAQGGETREETAGNAESGVGGSRGVRCLNPWDSRTMRQYDTNGVFPALLANSAGGQNRQGVVFESKSTFDENWARQDVKNALRANASKSSHVIVLQGNCIDRALTARCNGKGWREGECFTLNTIDRPAVVYDCRGNGDGATVPTLTGDHQNRVTDYTSVCLFDRQRIDQFGSGGTASTLRARDCKDAGDVIVERKRKYIVRRLTPLECCRLQGFPDWWEDGVEGSDSARYKMWGNGIALPCAVDVLRRIAKEMNRCKSS